MDWIYIFLIGIVITLLIIHFVNDWEPLTYGITEMFSTESAGAPTSHKNLVEIKCALQKEIDTEDFTFIDFGCGGGSVINEYEKDFKRLIGIELNPKLARIARRKTKHHNNVKIYNKDIQEYRFKRRPTILYLYEPLWQVYPIHKAMEIYENVINNLTDMARKAHQRVLIVYLTGLQRADLTDFFADKPYTLLKQKTLGFYPNRTLYIYEFDKTD
jgi:methyltransferase family protein